MVCGLTNSKFWKRMLSEAFVLPVFRNERVPMFAAAVRSVSVTEIRHTSGS